MKLETRLFVECNKKIQEIVSIISEASNEGCQTDHHINRLEGAQEMLMVITEIISDLPQSTGTVQ